MVYTRCINPNENPANKCRTTSTFSTFYTTKGTTRYYLQVNVNNVLTVTTSAGSATKFDLTGNKLSAYVSPTGTGTVPSAGYYGGWMNPADGKTYYNANSVNSPSIYTYDPISTNITVKSTPASTQYYVSLNSDNSTVQAHNKNEFGVSQTWTQTIVS